MKIKTLLRAIRDDLKSSPIGSVAKDIDLTPGQFDASELGRDSFKAPALRVAFLGAPKSQAQADSTRRYDLALAVFIITEGRDSILDGVDLMEAVAAQIEANRFSKTLENVGLPTNQRMNALYSTGVSKKGISLYAIVWTQTVRIGTSENLGSPENLDALIPKDVELTQHINTPEDEGEADV